MSYVLISFVAIPLAGCHENKTENVSVNSQQLYDETIAIIERYIDSLKVCKDTTRLKQLSSDLEESLAAVSRNYPALSDLWLSETQNDSISSKLDRFMDLYKKVCSQEIILSDSIVE